MRLLQYGALLFFILTSSAALLFALTRLRMPLVPYALVYLSYGSMAPYQGYVPSNSFLLAEGKDVRGEWKPIDLSPYYPHRTGFASVRMYLRGIRKTEGNGGVQDHLREQYTKLATLLLNKEQRKGNHWSTIRLSWQEWPPSPEGYFSLRKDPFVTTSFITSFP